MKVYEHYFKRPFDVACAALALVVFSPVLLLIALLVRLSSPGPVIFRQSRVGRSGCPFVMFKFRTMRVDAPDLRNADGTTYNAKDDPRVTRIGHLLRSTSIDELPQLLNVLRGEMSVVGPRPDLPEGLTGYQRHHADRLLVRPGLTSWAMLHGRNNVPLGTRRDLDAWYANHVSALLDLRIILRTTRIVLRREGVINEYSKGLAASPAASDTTRDAP